MPVTRSLPGLPDDYESKLFHGDMVSKVADSLYRGKVVVSLVLFCLQVPIAC
jgi:hypothetical protein